LAAGSWARTIATWRGLQAIESPQAGWTSYAAVGRRLLSRRRVDAWILIVHLTSLSSLGRDQLCRHDPQRARAGDEPGPPAVVRLVDPGLQLPADNRSSVVDRGDDAAHRPPLRQRLLRPGRWRGSASVAAPVLVLRPPRGLHHGAARLRDRLGGLAGVRPQGDLRLQGERRLDGGYRVPERAGWAHHMFTTPTLVRAFFMLSSFTIAVPTGIKIFN
jgi:hypothetical protein